MPGQEGRFGQVTGDARREQSKADVGSPSNWDATTAERFSSSPRNAEFKSEKRGVQAARNPPSEDRKWWQRLELGIHGLNRWAVNCLEMSGKRGVQTDKTPRARTEVVAAPCVGYPWPEQMGRKLSRCLENAEFKQTKRPERG